MELALNRSRASTIRRQIESVELVLAPDLLIPECVNAVWKEHRFSGLSLTVCDEVLAVLPALIDVLVPSLDLHREAFHLSRVSRRPAYDMFYLVLAKREDAVLISLDASLRKEAVRQGIRVS